MCSRNDRGQDEVSVSATFKRRPLSRHTLMHLATISTSDLAQGIDDACWNDGVGADLTCG